MKTVFMPILLFILTSQLCFASEFREGKLYPAASFDLETGHSTHKGQSTTAKYDLSWGCGPNETEYLRANGGVTWATPPNKNFNVGLSTMMQYNFAAPTDRSGYANLFYLPANTAQQLIGTVYYIKTTEKNIARLRIAGFDPQAKQRMVCRNLKIEYEVFAADGGWDSCQWVEVGIQKSHQPGSSWCPAGSLITQFDLDGETSISGSDAPIVGRARCCTSAKSVKGSCSWKTVGLQKSHQGNPDWCPNGSYLSQLDLDGGPNPQDYPIVGKANCCKAANNWGSCYWVEVGGLMSHQNRWTWCPNGSYLTQFDLDSVSNARPHDSPIVGRARCCTLGQ